jgi:hypothetical protein
MSIVSIAMTSHGRDGRATMHCPLSTFDYPLSIILRRIYSGSRL